MMRRILIVCLGLAVGMVGYSAVEAGDWSNPSGPDAVVLQPEMAYPADAAESPEWGTSDFYLFQIPPSAFQPRDSATPYATSASTAYIYRNGAGGESWFWAPLVLPAGANIAGMRLFFNDTNATFDVVSYITRCYGEVAPTCTDLAGPESSGSPGFGSDFTNPNVVVDYREAGGEEQCFILYVGLGATDNTTQFRGVRFYYYLQISAAPASATFSDVGTGHPFFQHVEALVDSGITAGCGGGNFCPNNPVTRGQMAVFLAKALGLHWNGNGH